MSDLGQFAEALVGKLGTALSGHKLAAGELTLSVPVDQIIGVLTHLRDDADCEFKILVDVCGNDWPKREKRFDVVYHLLSLTRNRRIRVKVMAGEGEVVPSCIGLYPAAGWFEREAFDMFGIVFPGHPDLRRLLTDYGFIGHPFRKDFPISGHVEMRYDPEQQRVIYQPVSIEQREIVPRVVREGHYGDVK